MTNKITPKPNKSVLITGGSRGIGAAAVRLFTSNGYAAAFIYRASEDGAAALSRETGAVPVRADVSRRDEVSGAYEYALNKLGASGFDVLVNNAGISKTRLFCDITPGEWDEMFAVNVSGTFNCTQLALPYMIREKHGKIVNVSSVWGITGASCEVHYSASKAAVIGMTRALAKELAPSGITVNCVAPGAVDTEMVRSLGGDVVAEIESETPLGRLGTPDEIARLILFLSSEDAAFITGQVVSPNGGWVI